MPEKLTVSFPPTSAVPLMVGFPVAGVFSARVTATVYVWVVSSSSAVTSIAMVLLPTLT